MSGKRKFNSAFCAKKKSQNHVPAFSRIFYARAFFKPQR